MPAVTITGLTLGYQPGEQLPADWAPHLDNVGLWLTQHGGKLWSEDNPEDPPEVKVTVNPDRTVTVEADTEEIARAVIRAIALGITDAATLADVDSSRKRGTPNYCMMFLRDANGKALPWMEVTSDESKRGVERSLHEVGFELERLLTRRAELVRLANAHGTSDRKIGRLVGLSHTQVAALRRA